MDTAKQHTALLDTRDLNRTSTMSDTSRHSLIVNCRQSQCVRPSISHCINTLEEVSQHQHAAPQITFDDGLGIT